MVVYAPSAVHAPSGRTVSFNAQGCRLSSHFSLLLGPTNNQSSCKLNFPSLLSPPNHHLSPPYHPKNQQKTFDVDALTSLSSFL